MYKLYCRSYQWAFRIVMPLLPWRKPELIEGEGCLSQLPQLLKKHAMERIIIVTDEGVVAAGLLDKLLLELKTEDIQYALYDKTVANPTIENIEEARRIYISNRCEAIIALGGGSPMDCAKGVAARIARPDKTLPQMKGELKIRKKTPYIIAIPTTAGTGSEATLVSVVSDDKTHEKYAINDPVLIPHYAILDPNLTLDLPPHITASTGMDALTHAIEAYIGRSNTEETRECSVEATKLIFEHLLEAYKNGHNVHARKEMQKAAYLAGVAFTRAYVGYVHAIAHTLGGFYGVPHGLANAVILPYVLEYYGVSITKPLAQLADYVGITDENDDIEQKATKFINRIKEYNKEMNIPSKIAGIKERDIPLMVERAISEANPLYPVPVILGKEDLTTLYHSIKA